MSTLTLGSSKPTESSPKLESNGPELPTSSSRATGSSSKPTKSSPKPSKSTSKPTANPQPTEPPFSSLPNSITELTEILTNLSHHHPTPPTISAVPHTAPPATSTPAPTPAPNPYHFPTTLGPHLHEQTYILSALTALLQLLHNQRWTPTTAATNLASLQRKRSTVSTLTILPPEPKGGGEMATLQYVALKEQKEMWEAMTVAQRECEYEELLERVDAARARVEAGEGERVGVGEEVLREFDAQFDEAVDVLVERWGVWATKGLGDDMVMPCLYGEFMD
ncbi:uncharacterized protein H6S33_005402 [Morchella sextelata]|uniref:uncharacterized protein n=1 Tax=Morchella sextelata TaxID=1174677 RepID=UPI001D0511A8|nr:uncharacterized protein H6S33_005402 [Morchella sextelata]KAH0613516.1 hypothetical protein H6S33_005402 [Morchella sextelata]